MGGGGGGAGLDGRDRTAGGEVAAGRGRGRAAGGDAAAHVWEEGAGTGGADGAACGRAAAAGDDDASAGAGISAAARRGLKRRLAARSGVAGSWGAAASCGASRGAAAGARRRPRRLPSSMPPENARTAAPAIRNVEWPPPPVRPARAGEADGDGLAGSSAESCDLSGYASHSSFGDGVGDAASAVLTTSAEVRTLTLRGASYRQPVSRNTPERAYANGRQETPLMAGYSAR